MALIPTSAFTPDASVGCSAGPTAAAVLLPGTPASDTTLRVTNIGNNPVGVKLGTSSAVTCTMSTGLVVMPGQTEYLGIGANTYLALCTGAPGTSSSVNLTTGN
jgi:hypothetical protein